MKTKATALLAAISLALAACATDPGAVAKYAGYAMSAIEVLAKALQSFGVKVA